MDRLFACVSKGVSESEGVCVCERDKETERGGETGRKRRKERRGGRGRGKERARECVCACVCVCEMRRVTMCLEQKLLGSKTRGKNVLLKTQKKTWLELGVKQWNWEWRTHQKKWFFKWRQKKNLNRIGSDAMLHFACLVRFVVNLTNRGNAFGNCEYACSFVSLEKILEKKLLWGGYGE